MKENKIRKTHTLDKKCMLNFNYTQVVYVEVYLH